MKRWFSRAAISVVLGMILLYGLPGSARAEVSVNINIGPPPVVVAPPAEVVLMPGIGVYFVPDAGVDLFFYAGYWWSPRGDRYYRSRAYNGPWVVVDRRYVPVEVVRVPMDYRVRFVKEKHVPYGQWKKSHRHKHEYHERGGSRSGGKHHQNKGRRGRGHDD